MADNMVTHLYGWLYALFATIGLLVFLLFSFVMYHRRLIIRKRWEWEYINYLKEHRPDLEGSSWRITRARKILTNTYELYPPPMNMNASNLKRLQSGHNSEEMDEHYLETRLSKDVASLHINEEPSRDTFQTLLMDIQMEQNGYYQHISQKEDPLHLRKKGICQKPCLEPIDRIRTLEPEHNIVKKRKKKRRLFRKSEQNKDGTVTRSEMKENKLFYSQARKRTDSSLFLYAKEQADPKDVLDIAVLEYNPYYTETALPIGYTSSNTSTIEQKGVTNNKGRKESVVKERVSTLDVQGSRALPVLDNVYFEHVSELSWM